VSKELEAQLDNTPGFRMHWTGCPDSCGQAWIQREFVQDEDETMGKLRKP